MGDPVTIAIIASTAVSVGSSMKQPKLAKKKAQFEQQQYESNNKLATQQAEADIIRARDRHEFTLGANLSLASRSGMSPFGSGSFLANRAYNQRVLDDTLSQINLNKNARISQNNLSISMSKVSAKYAVWGAASDIAGTISSSTYKLDQLKKDEV